MIRAGLAAAPYLLRLGDWQHRRDLLEDALPRDQSRATAAAVLPALRAIAAAAQEPTASRRGRDAGAGAERHRPRRGRTADATLLAAAVGRQRLPARLGRRPAT